MHQVFIQEAFQEIRLLGSFPTLELALEAASDELAEYGVSQYARTEGDAEVVLLASWWGQPRPSKDGWAFRAIIRA